MTEHPPTAIGTVAQEAARLIEDMASMARSTHSRAEDPGPYAAEPDSGSASREAPQGTRQAPDREGDDREAGHESSSGVCSVCGADGDDTPASCRICPLCRGIALLRSVRPETVDLLADLALSVAAGLRDVASRTRASAPSSPSRPQPGSQPDGERRTVQDIPVDDESE